MSNHNQELACIVTRASSFLERLNNGSLVDPLLQDSRSDQSTIDKRLENWAMAVSKGDMSGLQRRLNVDHLDLQSVRPILGSFQLKEGATLPAWTNILRAFVEQTQLWPLAYLDQDLLARDRCLDPDNPQDFEDILLPMVLVGRRLLEQKIGTLTQFVLLSDQAFGGLERYLLRRLAQISAPTLLHAFWQQRLKAQPMLAFLEPDDDERAGERPFYIQFVKEMLQPDKLWAFFKEYSVLARLLAETVEDWVTISAEFIVRFQEDWPLITERIIGEDALISRSQSIPQIEKIETGLSDPHHRGRTVIKLTLAQGNAVIYKPRGLGLDQAFQSLIAWINDNGDLNTLKTIPVLDRGTHGWTAFVPQRPCTTAEEGERFYRRCGMLVALMFVVNGRDFHFENIIADGEHPIPVDLEMLLYPSLSDELVRAGDPVAWQFKQQTAESSVLNSGILPFAERLSGELIDGSFLGAMAGGKFPVPRQRIAHVNSDHMRWEKNDRSRQAIDLSFDINSGRPQNFLGEIEAGFQAMAGFLLAEKDTLLAEKSPLHAFKGLSSRFVFRPTRVYYHILSSSLRPEYMREGIERHIQLEHLSRLYGGKEGSTPHFWPLIADEIAALQRGDIPIFQFFTDGRDLLTENDSPIPDCFGRSGYEQMMDNVANLCAANIRKQAAYLRLALHSLNIPLAAQQVQHTIPASIRSNPSWPVLDEAGFLVEAERIASQIVGMALTNETAARWVVIDYSMPDGRAHPTLAGYDLYNGQVGIATFLSGMWHKSKKAKYKTLAYAALHDLLRQLDQGPDETLQRSRLGGGAGLGSLVYGLTRCAQFLEDVALLEAAENAAALITPGLIARDPILDVIGGSAGALLGLLALYRSTGAQPLLDTALTCADHLLAEQGDSGGWKTYEGKQLTGFAHGAGGIAHALLRLGKVSGREDLIQAAQRGFAFEHQCYDPTVEQWPDRRYEDRVKCSWCHGAPGIALSRLAAEGQTVDLENGLRATYQAVIGADLDEPADPCCGHWGRVEILYDGGMKTGNEAYTHAALALASRLVADARQQEGYHLLPGLPRNVILPGFFKGLAGIGYSCLRLANHGRLPSVLMMA